MRFPNILSHVGQILDTEGVHAALRFLNSRTPHRFTGIYRYDGDMLRNVYLFDLYDPGSTQGQDVPMVDAYCANVGRAGSGIAFSNVDTDPTVETKSGSPVISYCGALIRDARGNPYGTLCHFDIKSCDTPVSDLPVLEDVAPLIYQALVSEGLPELAGSIS